MVKIESVTAEIFLICTNVFRTNVAWTNVTVKLSCGCVGVLTTDKATKAYCLTYCLKEDLKNHISFAVDEHRNLTHCSGVSVSWCPTVLVYC